MDSCPILIVIPARGGSKGIPRKNLRPLAGRPLLSYSVGTALACGLGADVCVSSEDDEILRLAESLGAVPIRRPEELAGDRVTLDPVIHDAMARMRERTGRDYGLVVTMQPTSPLLRKESLAAAVRRMLESPELDTVISAREDAHLSWRKEGDRFVPNYAKRLNRQQLPPEYRETGGFFVSRAGIVTPAGRIGTNVGLHILSGAETIDIDGFDDWSLCEYHLRHRKVLFVVSGYPEIGMGHVYNTLILAHEILEHEVQFLVDSRSALARDKIASSNYPVRMQERPDIVDDIAEIDPDVVINDRLDTEADYVLRLKGKGYTVINFEDLGEGARHADLVVNAIYPETVPRDRHYYGHRYFALRDEFLRAPEKEIRPEVREVLLTFGGVDPGNFTRKVLGEIYPDCAARGISIVVIAGPGYARYDTLAGFPEARILRDVTDIAVHMARADVVFTSAGRTTYEIASIGTPAIVLAQNERETTHFFASAEYGFLNLGLGASLPPGKIKEAFELLAGDPALRASMRKAMRAVDIRKSKQNVIRLISETIRSAR